MGPEWKAQSCDDESRTPDTVTLLCVWLPPLAVSACIMPMSSLRFSFTPMVNSRHPPKSGLEIKPGKM